MKQLTLTALIAVTFVLTFFGTQSQIYGATTVPYSFSPNTAISSSQVNSNFSALATAIDNTIKPVVVQYNTSSVYTFTGSCGNLMSSSITIPTTGTIVVEGVFHFYGDHTNGTIDDTSISVATTPTSCPTPVAGYLRIPSAYPTTPYLELIRFRKVFTNVGAGTITYYVNGFKYLGTSTSDYMSGGNMTVTFYPN